MDVNRRCGDPSVAVQHHVLGSRHTCDMVLHVTLRNHRTNLVVLPVDRPAPSFIIATHLILDRITHLIALSLL